MNLPNLLTLLRIFFVPLLVAALVQENYSLRLFGVVFENEFVALAIFLAAAMTDLLDGYLARRWGQVTTVGTLLDPIADKLLISAALISLVQVHALAGWMAVIIIAREFAVSGLRSIAAAEGYVIHASDLGKTKMVTQVTAIALVLLSMHFPGLAGLALWWMYGVVFFGVASAFGYFAKFWRKVDDSIKLRRRKELLELDRTRRRQLRAVRRATARAPVNSPKSQSL